MLTLNRIEANGPQKRTLRVWFTVVGVEHIMDCSGGEIQSFTRFQAVALERCGVLVRHAAEHDQEGKQHWLNAVERAAKAARDIE